jgi:tetratricopeptide (TPR) repeat protein
MESPEQVFMCGLQLRAGWHREGYTMRTLRLWILPAIAFLAFSVSAGASAPPQTAKESAHNRKGLEYYDEAFYRQLPNGKHREANGYFDLAVSEFKQAIAVNPRYTEAHRNLARLYYVRKDFPQAANSYRTVTILDPQDIDAYLQLALAYTEMDRFPEAIQALEAAKAHSSNPEILTKLDGYIAKLRNGK